MVIQVDVNNQGLTIHSNHFIKTTLTLIANIIAGIVQNREYHVPRKKQRNVNTIDNVK